MVRLLRSVSLFALLIASFPLYGQSQIDCDVVKSHILNHPIHYCIYLPASYDASASRHGRRRYPVLYFLHGLGDNEKTLFNSGGWALLDDLSKQHKIGDFFIVAPEGGRSFYINSSDGRVRYSDFFMQELVPFIDAKYPVVKGREGRAVSGVSMGGYGALRFAFSHPETFSAVSAQSAALFTESPQQLASAISSGAELGKVLAPVFGDPLDVRHWDENNPFALARKNSAAIRRVSIYFNCGQDDNYGFEKGAAALHEELAKKEIKHEYHSYPGDHSLTYFLSHFPEVIEFHSQAFGLVP